jgi:DNA adenine methylase
MAKPRGRQYPLPHPFLKWAGGKRGLLDRILPRLPEAIDTYVEPFVGGGAVFLELARQKRVKRAILGDANPELIDTWREVRDHPDALVELVQQWPYDEKVYYELRALDPAKLPPTERAARMLWLNRTGFNGLYRLNRSGEFNVPFGRHTNPRLVNAENLRAVSAVLQDVELRLGDFEEILALAPPGAVAYCDPPYWPVSVTSSFSDYQAFRFGPAEQKRLSEVFRGLPARGVYGVLSNSHVPQTLALYGELPHDVVHVRRSINRDADGRGEVRELLVRTHAKIPRA